MLALIAGEGALPAEVIARLEADARPFQLCEMEGHPSDARGDRPIVRFRVETLGSFIAELQRLGVAQVCFAGRIARPALDPSAIDPATMPLVPRMMAALQLGDDAALRMVLSFFEEAGFQVCAAHELVPELLAAAGVQGKVEPSEADRKDADRGVEILAAMAVADVGQACIVAQGQALALEAMGGTDWMMRSLMMPPDGAWSEFLQKGMTQRDATLPEGGVLVKASKQGQDRRVDMPTIGPQTFARAAEIGLRGIVIEAGGVMVLNPATCIEMADARGLFFWVRG